MDLLSLLFGLLAGLIAGVLVHAQWSAARGNTLMQAVRESFHREKEVLQQRLDQAEKKGGEQLDRAMALGEEVATEKERNRALTEKLNTQHAELEQLQARLTSEFENIANKLLEAKGRQLNEQQQERLGNIVKPLQDRLREFEEQVRKSYEIEGRERFALKKEIGRLVEQNQRLSQEANDLTRALKGDTQAQGAWGEMILDRLLESSGLVKDQHYTMQASTTMEDGLRLRPDAVVMLPEDKHLIIDSKVSLVHYERFTAATEETEKQRLLKQHIESLRMHARGLGEKNYTQLYGVRSVDFVLMFVPLEPAFLLALRERPEIFQEAYDRQVVMVTHTTLMATLRTIHGIWKNEQVARNHLEIAKRAGALYEKFVGFTEDLGRIGKHVRDAQDSYDKALGKLSEGPGNLVRQVEMLKELGARTNKTIHPRLMARAAEGSETEPA